MIKQTDEQLFKLCTKFITEHGFLLELIDRITTISDKISWICNPLTNKPDNIAGIIDHTALEAYNIAAHVTYAKYFTKNNSLESFDINDIINNTLLLTSHKEILTKRNQVFAHVDQGPKDNNPEYSDTVTNCKDGKSVVNPYGCVTIEKPATTINIEYWKNFRSLINIIDEYSTKTKNEYISMISGSPLNKTMIDSS